VAVQQVRSVALPSLAIAAGATTPNPGLPGVWVWSTTLNLPVHWDGDSWKANTSVTVGTTAPSNPSVGDVWIDTN
jgi:hypothetical protein